MNQHKILLVDDDTDLSAIIAQMLEGCGYQVTCAGSAAAAIDALTTQSYQLILMDINLPDGTGFAVCEELRQVSHVPVLFASARTTEDDRIHALSLGGDAFLSKPYSMKELLAHVNALMRRTYGFSEAEQTVRFGNVTVRLDGRTVTKNGQPVELAQREYDLLAYLCRHRNTAIPKDTLLSEVWGAFSEVAPATLAVHMRWLREKLEDDPAKPQFLKTIWRMGYMLETEDET